jgi:GMP synthase-like glutamine amidotransferase
MDSRNRRVLVLRHAEPEHLGAIAHALVLEGVGYTYVSPYGGQDVPVTLDGFGGLVLMGGPQSVYEEDKYPFLKEEKRLTSQAIERDVPVLGVCLGSQLLAEVLGSKVHSGAVFELGWKKVMLNPEASSDRVLGHLPKEITPFHWHGDIYDLPPGAKLLASSQLTQVQGFAFRDRFYGLLFHLEVGTEQIAAMTATFPDDVRRGGATTEGIMAESPERVEALRDSGVEAFRRWAALV